VSWALGRVKGSKSAVAAIRVARSRKTKKAKFGNTQYQKKVKFQKWNKGHILGKKYQINFRIS
jgi:hypothetical protein